MPAEPPRWPALAAEQAAGGPLVHRAVLGKVHQAASDFRWIAHSAAIQPRKLGLDRLLSLGPEDRPVRAAAWRSLPDACVAVVCYRSRAVDRVGRSGGLEKQIFYWPAPEPGDVVAGAFTLLGALESASDGVWWADWEDYRWEAPDFFLPLEPETVPAGHTELSVEQGLAQLTGACDEPQLAALYAELLADGKNRPAVLGALTEPLPPLALAALLLPFEPEQARRLSLAGALPNSRQVPGALANWDAVVRTGDAPEVPGERLQPTPEQLERGARMAAAIWAGSPDTLRPAPARFVPAPPPPEPEPQIVEAQPTPVQAAPLVLSPVAEGFSRFLEAGDGQRALEAILGNAEMLDEPAGRFLLNKALDAIRELKILAQGDSPKARQLAMKIEQIRAWMLSCYPHPDVLRELGVDRNERLPPLLFAADIPAERWAQACQLDPNDVRGLIAACGRLERGFTRSQLEKFQNWGRDPAVRSRTSG